MIGYSVGCDGEHADSSFTKASDENRMSVVDPVICPDQQYGYDPRCRDWYVEAIVHGTYLSPPYITIDGDMYVMKRWLVICPR